MSETSKVRRSENQSTFFLYDRHNREEAIRAQNEDQMITHAMGGPLAEQDDITGFQRVLSVACGSGNWVIDAAQRYPHMSLVGIDIDPHVIDYARENAVATKVADRVGFHVMDALRPLDFPDASFDLVNLRLGVTFVRTWEWSELISEMVRVTCPGGVIRLTEPDIIHQNKGPICNPALLQMQSALICALYRSGHLFEEDTTGITAQLPLLLTRFGFKDVQTKAYPLDFRARTREWQMYCTNASRVMQGWRSFLGKRGCFDGDYDALYQQAIEEIRKPDCHIVWNFLTTWGKTPL